MKKISRRIKKKYNMDDIFKRKEYISERKNTNENVDANKLPIKIEHEKLFKRVLNSIMKFFHKK